MATMDDPFSAAQAAWPGIEFNQPQDEVCILWSDFRQNRYEQGEIIIAQNPVGEPVEQAVFNGTETTRRYPAMKDGAKCYFVRTTFDPDFGHANYGDARFEAA